MPGRIRTFDRPIKSRMLYQLSYGHIVVVSAFVKKFSGQSTPTGNSIHFLWENFFRPFGRNLFHQ